MAVNTAMIGRVSLFIFTLIGILVAAQWLIIMLREILVEVNSF